MYHYNAFISYNHNPRDIKIAKTLQHQLENFKIPKDLKSSADLKEIERVFLDTGELEVAGDLNKVICDVLEDTDYLIVICSPESKKSIWVKREIDYYLRNHSIDTVLTVISDGEPFDVLPDRLLYDDSDTEVESDTEDINEDLTPEKPHREPLSCDYRLPPRAARTTELPRLAAAILGCKYDDLVQRQRHYRQRRLMTIASAAGILMLAAISYLIWSNNQINKNLEASLTEQSTTLAIQSEQALGSGDRVGAIQYAVDALPSEENDRPVVPRAMLALSNALDMYKVVPNAMDSALRKYPSYGSRHLKMETIQTDDRIFMTELFNNGRCVLWDADTGYEIMHDYTDGLMSEGIKVQNLATTDSGNLVLITDKSIRVLDCVKETEIKKIDLDGEYFKFYDFNQYICRCDELIINDGKIWIPVASKIGLEKSDDYTLRKIARILEDSTLSISRDSLEITELAEYMHRKLAGISYEIICADLKTGDVISKTSAPDRPAAMTLSRDGKKLACIYSDFYSFRFNNDKSEDDRVILYDAQNLKKTGEIRSAFISDFVFDKQGDIVLCGFDKQPDPNDTSLFGIIDYTDNGSRTLLSMAKDREMKLTYCDADTCDEIWSRVYNIHASGVPIVTTTSEKDFVPDAIMCILDNHIQITGTDGESIDELNLSSPLVAGLSNETGIVATLRNGEIASCIYDKENGFTSSTSHNTLLGPVSIYQGSQRYTFTVSDDYSKGKSSEIVIQYTSDESDPEWKAYEYDESAYSDKYKYSSIGNGYYGSSFVEVRAAEDPSVKSGMQHYVPPAAEILVRDSQSGKITLQKTVELAELRSGAGGSENKYYSFLYSSIDSSRGKVYFIDNNEYTEFTLLSVDLKSGEEKKTPLKLDNKYGADVNMYDLIRPSELYDAYEESAGIVSIDDSRVCLAAFEGSYTQGTEEEGTSAMHIVLLEADPETGKTEVTRICEIDEDFEPELYSNVRVSAAAERVMILNGSNISSYDFKGRELWTSEELAYAPSGFTIAEDGRVIALERNGTDSKLHIYSADKGRETAVTELGGAILRSYEDMSCIDMSDDEVMVTAGDDAYLIDKKSWELRSVISDTYIAYEPETKEFMLGNADDRITGHAPYRSLEEMVAEANTRLGK